jgi:DNA-binding NarL/FixJ family response regulator
MIIFPFHFKLFSITHSPTPEKEVLRSIASGCSNKEIAQKLFISEETVRNHITHILTRLELRDRTQAAIVANTFISFFSD